MQLNYKAKKVIIYLTNSFVGQQYLTKEEQWTFYIFEFRDASDVWMKYKSSPLFIHAENKW